MTRAEELLELVEAKLPLDGKISALKTVMKNIYQDLSKKVESVGGKELVALAGILLKVEKAQYLYYKEVENFRKSVKE